MRRLREGKDRAIVFGADKILRDRAARGSHAALIGASQIGANLLPTGTIIKRTKHMIAGREEHIGVMRRKHDREGPLETISEILGRPAAGRLGPDANIARL